MRDHCRNLARIDLYFLLRYGLRRADAERQWVLDRCREVQANPDGHLDLWAREHYKSTIITFALTIQDILSSHGDSPLEKWQGREATVGIFSHTRPIAKGFLRQIKTEFEQSIVLKEWFPDVLWQNPKKEAPKWSEDEGIVVKRKGNPKEATVEAWGLVDGQPTSKHFLLRVYDDVVTVESVNTAEMIAKTTERLEMSWNLGVDGGIERYIGTRYDELDTYQALLERKAAIPRIRAATDDGTLSGCPVLLSQDVWQEKKRRTSVYILSCQMLQNPTPSENAFWRQVEGETVLWYDKIPKHLRVYACSDGAVSKGKGDWTVHIVFGIDPNDDVYLLDLWRKQVESDVWINRQIDYVQEFKRYQMPIVKWVGEGGVIEKAVGPLRRKLMAERKCWFTYETLPSITDKESRAAATQGRWNQGKIYLPRDAEWIPDFLLELKRFPGTVDDQVDAFGMIGRMLDDMHRGTVPARQPSTAYDSPEFIRSQIAKLGQPKYGEFA